MVSYVFGVLVSKVLGKVFFGSLIKSSILGGIEEGLTKKLNITQNMEEILKGFGGSSEPFINNTVGNFLVKTFLSKILFLAVFFCIFSIFRVIKRYILKLSKVAKKMPIIGALDGFLGAICGVFKAFIFLFIFAIVCFIVIVITKDELFFMNNECINSTYLFFLFYKIINFLK